MLAKKANTESHLIKELPTLTLSFASCQALMERLKYRYMKEISDRSVWMTNS